MKGNLPNEGFTENKNSISQSRKIYVLVEELVGQLSYQPSSSLVGLCMKILGSRIHPRTTDEIALVQRIKKKLIQDGKNNTLSSDNSQESIATEVNEGGFPKGGRQVHNNNNNNNNNSQGGGRKGKKNDMDQGNRDANGRMGTNHVGLSNARKFEELYSRLLEHTIVTNKRAILSLLFSLMNLKKEKEKHGAFIDEMPIEEKLAHQTFTEPVVEMTNFLDVPKNDKKQQEFPQEKTSFEISEQLLLRDVLYAFQGINSQYVYLNSKTDCFEIAPTIGTSAPMRDLVRKLCELGWLFNRIVEYIQSTSGQKTSGVVCQSFCYALQLELSDYYRLIAILEAQVGDPSHEDSLDNERLTMRRLNVWVHEPLERLRFMACLVDGAQNMRGGALASRISQYLCHGDPFIRDFVESIIRQLAAPLFMMIRRWVFEGELDDPNEEFFVRSDPLVTDGESLWLHKYTLNSDMIPSFISLELATKILAIGKSINFIRQCCDDTEWVMDSVAAVMADAESLEYGDFIKLNSVIAKASQATNEYLTKILLEKYSLLDHCRALKQYLLLGQGDFIQYLMDLLGPELSKRASQIYRHNLMGVLETAINSSNAKFESPAIMECLDVKLHQPTAGDDGWDVFSLHYKLQSPLNSVIGESSMSDYLRIFKFLWRLKRVEYSLSTSWARDMNLSHIVQECFPDLANALHHSHLLRNEMIHFTSNLHNYMMFEVLETSWRKLVSDMKNAKDLDEMIASHQEYLVGIQTKALMVEESKQLLDQLVQIFKIIIRFCKAQEILYTNALKEAHLRKLQTQQMEARTEQGGWGISNFDLKESSQSLQQASSGILSQILDISKKYNEEFIKLLGVLHSQCAGSENLRFLTFRLDFNEFYQKKMQVKTSN